MSFYNMIHGVKPATFFILPMLGKHPDEYPRFRDCFLGDDEREELKDHIHVYTRTGGGNREGYEEENQAMREMPGFVTDYDDGLDCTFASWVFQVPERWKAEYDKIMAGNIKDVSAEYQAELRRVYPKLSETWDKIFSDNSNAMTCPACKGSGQVANDEPGLIGPPMTCPDCKGTGL